MNRMSSEVRSGLIEAHDIVEQNRLASIWRVTHRQLSAGKFLGRTRYATLRGILLYRQTWSSSGLVSGLTPANYLALGGPSSPQTHIRWRGEALNAGCLAYGLDSAETDFLLPDGSDHWVILVPKDKLVRYFGEETAAAVVRSRDVLRCEAGLGLQLFAMVERVIGRLQTDGGSHADDLTLNAIESQLLGTVAEILLAADEGAGRSTARKRYLACHRALGCVDGLKMPITVPELAARVGVSERVLELGFKENLGIPPQKYIRWNRMNRLHRELRASRRGDTTVTEMANRWGFHELGRTAVEYKQLFGESPSESLAGDPKTTFKRLADIVRE